MIPFLKKQESPTSEYGFTTAWMLGLVLIIISIGGAFYDFSGALTQRQKLISISERASNAGATALDEQELIDSDGSNVILKSGSPAPAPDETAIQRCENVIAQEMAKPHSVIESYVCGPPSNGDPRVIVATVTGKVSYGVIASFVGQDDQTFTVSSRGQPSCSDGSC